MSIDCGYVTRPEIGQTCRTIIGRTWLVYVQTNSRTPIEEPLVRCDEHLAPTIAALMDRDTWLDLREVTRS